MGHDCAIERPRGWQGRRGRTIWAAERGYSCKESSTSRCWALLAAPLRVFWLIGFSEPYVEA